MIQFQFHLCKSFCVCVRAGANSSYLLPIENTFLLLLLLLLLLEWIQGGNDNDSFILSDPIEGILVMNKALDFDHGNREYKIQIQASVSTNCPPHSPFSLPLSLSTLRSHKCAPFSRLCLSLCRVRNYKLTQSLRWNKDEEATRPLRCRLKRAEWKRTDDDDD